MSGQTRQQRRNELARAEGYRNYTDKRNAKMREAGYRNYADARAKRAKGQPLPGDKAGRRRVVKTGGGTIVKSTPKGRGLGIIEKRLRNGGDRQAFASVTVNTPDGPRRVRLFGHGGWNSQKFSDAVDKAGGLMPFFLGRIAEMYEAGWAHELQESDLTDLEVTWAS